MTAIDFAELAAVDPDAPGFIPIGALVAAALPRICWTILRNRGSDAVVREHARRLVVIAGGKA